MLLRPLTSCTTWQHPAQKEEPAHREFSSYHQEHRAGVQEAVTTDQVISTLAPCLTATTLPTWLTGAARGGSSSRAGSYHYKQRKGRPWNMSRGDSKKKMGAQLQRVQRHPHLEERTQAMASPISTTSLRSSPTTSHRTTQHAEEHHWYGTPAHCRI